MNNVTSSYADRKNLNRNVNDGINVMAIPVDFL